MSKFRNKERQKTRNPFHKLTRTQKIISVVAVVLGGIGIIGAISSSSDSSINNEIVINGHKYGNQLSNLDQHSMAYKDGWVYYSVITDYKGSQSPDRNKHGIFRVRLDGSENQQITSGYDARYISILGDWIYYEFDASEIRRTKIDGSTTETLTNDITNNGHINVVDDYVYYNLTGDGVYRIKTDGKGGPQKIASVKASYDLIVADGWIYFYGGGEKKGAGLGRIKIDGSGEQMLYDGKTQFAINGDYIYFSPVYIPDMEDKGREGLNYDTYRMKIDGSGMEKFIENDEIAYCYNGILYSYGFKSAYTLDGKKIEDYSSPTEDDGHSYRAYYIGGHLITKETEDSSSDKYKIIKSDLDSKNVETIFDNAEKNNKSEVTNVSDFLSRLDGAKFEGSGIVLTISREQFEIHYVNGNDNTFKINKMQKIEQSEGGGYRFVVSEEDQTSVTGYTMHMEEAFEILLDGTEVTYCESLGCDVFKRTN